MEEEGEGGREVGTTLYNPSYYGGGCEQLEADHCVFTSPLVILSLSLYCQQWPSHSLQQSQEGKLQTNHIVGQVMYNGRMGNF